MADFNIQLDRFYTVQDYIEMWEQQYGKQMRTVHSDYEKRCEECAFFASCQLRYEYDSFVKRHNSVESFQKFRSYGMFRDDPCVLFAEHDDSDILGHPGRECGSVHVSDGIGDDYKIELQDGYPNDNVNTWRTYQPILIWAPTSSGKNYFVNERLVPYVKDLSFHDPDSRKHRVLILSNRLALKNQIKAILRDQSNLENDDQQVFHEDNDFVTVMTYQSLLSDRDRLERIKNGVEVYPFVICDEAHFFTSDAAFNPETERILSCLTTAFSRSIRIYMSATPYECLNPIKLYERVNYGSHPFTSIRKETGPTSLEEGRLHGMQYLHTDLIDIPPACYHFSGSYDYLDIFSFKNFENEMIDKICESIEQSNENWVIFIDSKKELADIERTLRYRLKKKKSPKESQADQCNIVLNVSAESKRSLSFQDMVTKERLPEGIRVLLSTSVLDNGINLRNVDNIVVMEMDKVKCLQMVGRARVSTGKRKKLYLKQFGLKDVQVKLAQLEKIQLALTDYGQLQKGTYPGGLQAFFDKYYLSREDSWHLARHLFQLSLQDESGSSQLSLQDESGSSQLSLQDEPGSSQLSLQDEPGNSQLSLQDEPGSSQFASSGDPSPSIDNSTDSRSHVSIERVDDQIKPEWYLEPEKIANSCNLFLSNNTIERSMVELNLQYYRHVRDEMETESQNNEDVGQQYLAYQYSWFGKNYDASTSSPTKAKKSIESWFEDLIEKQITIVYVDEKDKEIKLAEDQISDSEFAERFRNLYEPALGTYDLNGRNDFGWEKINNRLKASGIPYHLEGPRNRNKGAEWHIERGAAAS